MPRQPVRAVAHTGDAGATKGVGLTGILKGLRIIEGSAFVAVPLAGMTLAQMGADVIRFDRLRGGLDAARWPVTRDGRSLFWARPQQGQTVDRRRPHEPEGPGGHHRPHHRPGARSRLLSHQSPGARLDGLPCSFGEAPGPDHGLARRRLPWCSGRGLHGQSGRGLSRRHRAQGVDGAGGTRPAGLGLHCRADGGDGPARGRTAPAQDRPRPALPRSRSRTWPPPCSAISASLARS